MIICTLIFNIFIFLKGKFQHRFTVLTHKFGQKREKCVIFERFIEKGNENSKLSYKNRLCDSRRCSEQEKNNNICI